ncbi:MAG: hypothetical protein ACOX8R_04630 [Bacillota bacterium]|jgi:hypothetical protein
MKVLKGILLIFSSMAAMAAVVYAVLQKREECIEGAISLLDKVKGVCDPLFERVGGFFDRVFTENDFILADDDDEELFED